MTIPEGLRPTQVAGILASEAEIDSVAFMAVVTDPALIRGMLPLPEGEPVPPSLEGYLLRC